MSYLTIKGGALKQHRVLVSIVSLAFCLVLFQALLHFMILLDLHDETLPLYVSTFMSVRFASIR